MKQMFCRWLLLLGWLFTIPSYAQSSFVLLDQGQFLDVGPYCFGTAFCPPRPPLTTTGRVVTRAKYFPVFTNPDPTGPPPLPPLSGPDASIRLTGDLGNVYRFSQFGFLILAGTNVTNLQQNCLPFGGIEDRFDLEVISAYPTKGTKQITATVFDCSNGMPTSTVLATATLSFEVLPEAPPPPPQPQLRLEETSLGLNAVVKDLSGGQTINVQVPLGDRLKLRLLKKDANGGADAVVPSVFAPASSATIDSDPETDANTLFPKQVFVQFDTRQAGTEKLFQTLHLGKQSLTVTPVDTTLQPVTVNVTVYLPASMTGAHHEFDSSVFLLAHKFGIPPQFIKAQIAKEGQFDPLTWRYEPLNDEVGDLKVSRGDDLRAEETDAQPYGFYRLPAVGDKKDPGTCKTFPDPDLRIPDDQNCPGLDEGTRFRQRDVDFIIAQRFPISIPERDPQTGALILNNGRPVLRHLQVSDRFVSVQDVFNFNNRRYNWSNNGPESRLNGVNFSAQLTLGASYGLLQTTYVRAISTEHWQGTVKRVGDTQIGQNPSYLYDTPDNIAAGGGSLTLGCRIIRANFRKVSRQNATRLAVDDYVSFQRLFAPTYQLYNFKQKGYGKDIIFNLSQGFVPIASRGAFDNGGK